MTQDQKAQFLLAYAAVATFVSLGTLFEVVWFPLTVAMAGVWIILAILLPGRPNHGRDQVQ